MLIACGRSFEQQGLEPLLAWAHASLDRSINRAALPYLIVVKNKAPHSEGSPRWSTEYATNELLRDLQGALDAVPSIRKLAQSWRDRGFPINSILDLIHQYYSNIRVVNIPPEGRSTRTKLMLEQIRSLRDEIKRAAQTSHDVKNDVRMLSTSHELGLFMQYAYAHFSHTLRRPFDFTEVSLKVNPLPKHLRGNMLQLAITLSKDGYKAPVVFMHLSKLIASCVLLDCIRTGRKGMLH